ncbi:unnamed protein product [Clonostachys byssicola]|uniref:Mid2 domain-containing protein n=1 Tax=Clonostachys byssicola TaxID=160290 RepID=A0A9N9YCS1_9HYPO|nr:unnamed protein product [Clonostachys byssicola]
MQPVLFAASFLWLCSFVLSKNIFNKPPSGGVSGDYSENPTYQEGQQVDFLWESDVKYVDIGIFQKYPVPADNKHYSAYVVRNTSKTSYRWNMVKILRGESPPEGENSIFWLIMYDTSTEKLITDSHYFNVSRIRTTATTSTTSESSASTSAVPTATADSQASGTGLSSGAIAGIAVGATLAGVLVTAAIAFFFWRHLQTANRGANAHPSASGAGDKPIMDGQHQRMSVPPHYNQVNQHPGMTGIELTTDRVHEAP